MKKQQGAALIVVMSLLSVSLTLGLMNMQTSQVDERLAGNYKAAAEAQMAAEYGAAERLSGSSAHSESRSCDEAQKYPSHSVDKEEWSDVQGVGSGSAYYRYIRCEEDGVKSTLVMGCVGSAGQDLSCRFVSVSDLGGGEIDGEGVEDFLDWLDKSFPQGGVRTCSVGEVDPSQSNLYFCDGDFSGDLSGDFEGVTLVANGEMSFKTPANADAKNLDLVALESVTFNGGGKSEISGGIWSGGKVTINGGGNQEFSINVCSAQVPIVNGGSLAGDDQGCSWAEGLAEDLGYSPSGGLNWIPL